MPQIARCNSYVLYRHSGSGGTKFARPGEELPESIEEGVWEALAEDNIKATDTIPVLVQAEDYVLRFNVNSIPEEGQLFNFRQVGTDEFPSSGLFRVKEVWIVNNDAYCVSVARLSDVDPGSLIFDLEVYSLGRV